jgi:hypothetical protein
MTGLARISSNYQTGRKNFQRKLHNSQSSKRAKYGHESCGTQNQELPCCQEPAAIYLTNQLTDRTSREHSCTTPRVVQQKNMIMNPVGLGTKNYCSGEGQQQFTQTNPTQTNTPIQCWWLQLVNRTKSNSEVENYLRHNLPHNPALTDVLCISW